MFVRDDYWPPLAPYADVEETIAAEARILSSRAVEAGPRLSLGEFIELHEKRRGYHISRENGRLRFFADGLIGPGNLYASQWYRAWEECVAWEDRQDKQDSNRCAADVAVQ